MLAYAPHPERRRLRPTALALIVSVHAAAILAVMSAKMEVTRQRTQPTIVATIKLPPEPEAKAAPETRASQPANSAWTAPQPLIEPLPLPGPLVEPLLPPDPGPLVGNGVEPPPPPKPLVRSGPRFATPDGDVRPPYPESKRAMDEEATLRLRLSIDERGRVVAVEPVGRADPAFLAAARRHILRAWRYQPAMEGDRSIASSTVITLKFELD
jgi:periplasmic protein TonB